MNHATYTSLIVICIEFLQRRCLKTDLTDFYSAEFDFKVTQSLFNLKFTLTPT